MKLATAQECLEAMDAVNLLRDYLSKRELDPAMWHCLSLQLHALHALAFDVSESRLGQETRPLISTVSSNLDLRDALDTLAGRES